METERVVVRLQSRFTAPGEAEGEIITAAYQGELERTNAGFRLRYREGEEAGLGRTDATLEGFPGGVALERRGETATRMVFREGKAHSARYETPYGALPLTVRARQVRWALGERGGELELRYDLELAGAPHGETHLRLTFAPA